MYATVIPLLRTPIGVDAFDYRIPNELDIEPGMLVIIPFRKKHIIGLVESIMPASAFSDKASEIIGRYDEVRFPKGSLELLSWLSLTTFCSKPTILKTWLRQLPKKPKPVEKKEIIPQAQSRQRNIQWLLDSRGALVDAVNASTERVLVLTPWKHRAEDFLRHIPDSAVLSSDLGIRDFFAAWRGFMSGDIRVLLTTRVGAWLASAADRVVIDEPENDDHKQDDLSPRFDARRIAFWSQSHGCAALDSYGLTPPIHVQDAAAEIPLSVQIIVRHPKGRSPVSFIESESLDRLRSHDGPVIVIHPIQGERSRIICADCGWQAECARCAFPLSSERSESVCRLCKQTSPLPLECPLCRSVDLSKSIPGMDTLRKQFAEHEPEIEIEWRSTNAIDLERPFPEGSYVLLTAGDLLGAPGSEDIRRNERLAVAYRRLADAIRVSHSTLLIQSSESLSHEWKRLLTTEGFDAFRREELLERETFGYPPHQRLVKVIVTGEEAKALAWKQKAEQALRDFDVQGPFPVAFMPSSRESRFVIHLRPPIDMREKTLISLLTPFAASAIIDLDPIAFFR